MVKRSWGDLDFVVKLLIVGFAIEIFSIFVLIAVLALTL